jgi:hypothetical protein
MAAGLGGIESLSSLDGDFFELSDLADELGSFGLLMGKLFRPSFGGFLELFVDFIPDGFVFSLLGSHHLPCLILAAVYFFD